MRLSWSPPPNSVCIGGYLLQYGPSENELREMNLPGDLNQYLLTGLQQGTSYMMTLSAEAGDEIGEEALIQWYQGRSKSYAPVNSFRLPCDLSRPAPSGDGEGTCPP